MTQQKFIGRKRELQYLDKRYQSKRAENIIIYGRRRIGKTELLLEFCKGKPALYFLATNDSEQQNINSLKEVMARFLNDSTFLEIHVDNWVSLFTLFFKFNKEKKKIVICIDEFPYLVSLHKGILSVFQKIWDENLKNKNVMLILNGSSISMMEEYALSPQSPFYGRRTGQWNVTEMNLNDVSQFFPNYTNLDILHVISLIGGIPGYLTQFDKRLSPMENIKEHVLSKGAYLYEEVDILLRDEFREPKNYKLLLHAISLGHTTLGEICNYTGLDKSMISKYLDTLQKTRIVTAKLPVTARKNAKKQLYYIEDFFFIFWFSFVHKYKIDLEANRVAEVHKIIQKDFPTYMGYRFEVICSNLIREGFFLQNKSFSQIGSWWYKDAEIDIVALDDTSNTILFGECKWQDAVDAEKVFFELQQKTMLVDWHINNRTEHFIIFAKSFKHKKRLKNCTFIDLQDIENALFRR